MNHFIITISHEGSEGEIVKKFLLFIHSFASKESFFTHVVEGVAEEESSEEDPEEQLVPVEEPNKQQVTEDSEQKQILSVVTRTKVYIKCSY